MIIEILEQEDVLRVEDELLRKYLEYSLERLPEGFDYYNHVREYGYFCVVTTLEDLSKEMELRYCTLLSIKNEKFWDYVELVEMNESYADVIEVLVRVDTDTTMSLIFRKSLVDDTFLVRIGDFVY